MSSVLLANPGHLNSRENCSLDYPSSGRGYFESDKHALVDKVATYVPYLPSPALGDTS